MRETPSLGGIRALIEKQLVSRNHIKSIFGGAGFDTISHKAITHQISLAAVAERAQTRADSFLARLPDDDFHAGMTLLRAHVEHADPGETVTDEVDFFVFQR